jgi:ABC-type Fe3+ transport system permease subunit
VLTSRFNTFAIAVVAGLLALIGGLWFAKLISRRKVGKHKRRNLGEATKEGPGAEGA